MAYQSLYRKYRPQTFSDVMGQGHVTRTLQNALASGRVAHGYLFTGTRGTAKTTVARLLAKALNCESQPQPVAEPCNQCDACRSITAGTCIDVVEMDAASHRGVADVEEVRKSVGYGPMQFRYKVFIIDEAHQLSSDAKDAFLKTLEEPPNNVVFILATTEPQAIPITIRSRCQQFDFKRGSLGEITTRLAYVLQSEGVTYEAAALALVARGAEGSYRDSLSLLEQVLAFAPKHIRAADVDTVLGTLDADMLSRVTDAVARRDASGAFALAGQLLDAGKEARTLLRTLALHFRDLLLVAVGGPAVSAEMTPEEVQALQQESRRFSPPQMMRAIDVLNEAQGETRWNNQHRLLVELTFLKLMQLGDGQGSGEMFATAPIVFAPAVATATVAAPPPTQPVIVPAPVAPTPAPVAVAVAASPTPAPAPVVTPPVAPPAPVAEAAPVPAVAATTMPAAPTPVEESLPAGFFADGDSAADEDDEDYSYGDEDAPPEDDSVLVAAPPAPAEPIRNGNAPVSAPSFSVYRPDEEEGSEPDAAPEVDQGPGLFDEWEPAAPVAAPPSPIVEPVAAVARNGAATAPEPEKPPVAPQPPAPVKAPEPAPSPRETGGGGALPGFDDGAMAPPAPEAPIVSIDRVRQVWPRFLQEAERISKRTAVMMRTAEPMEVAGKTVVIRMSSRANFEMFTGKKEGQEFVRKLLALCLGLKSLGVRFELDPTQAAPPTKTGASPKPDQQRHNPLAMLEAMVRSAEAADGQLPAFGTGPAALPPAPQPWQQPRRNGAEDGGWGRDAAAPGPGKDSAFGFAPAPLPPAGPPADAVFATAPRGRVAETPASRYAASERESVPWPPSREGDSRTGSSSSGNSPEALAKVEAALQEPLIQEVLQIFGGEIVVD